MTESRAARWASTRKNGKKRFILKAGVLSWGIPMFIVMTFFVNNRTEQKLTLMLIAGSALLWALAGAFFGWMLWGFTEKQYNKFLNITKAGKS